MKITIFYRNLSQGGVQKMMVKVANYFASKGFSVTLLLIRKEGVFFDQLDKSVVVKGLDVSGFFNILKKLTAFIRDEKPTVLFTATPTLNITSLLARYRARAKTKVILSERISPLQELKGKPHGLFKLSFLFIPIIYRLADGIIAVSKGVAYDLSKYFFLDNKSISVVYNPAYETSYFENEVLHKWLSPDGHNVISIVVSAGRLSPQKNFKLTIDALNVINADKVKVRLIILGEGEQKQELEDYIMTLGASEWICMAGFVKNPKAWIAQADLFVLSSKWEGFGNILIDALSAQTTIVSTSCKSGPSEILGDGLYGYLLNDFTPESMAKAIAYALSHKMEKSDLLKRAQEFSEEKIMMHYENIFFK